MQLKILSWNIWGGQHFPLIVDFLRGANADVIGLQEVIEDLDGTKNTAQMIAEELGYEWFYLPTYEVETARLYHLLEPRTVKMGNAILSRYKISGTKAHELSQEKKRFALEALIPLNGRTLHAFSTHLLHTHQKSSELQDLQAENLLKFIPKENALVMADLNAAPESNPVKIVSRELINTDQDFRPTWSVYPEGCPVCKPQRLDTRLDYIFTSKDMQTNSFTVHDSKGADHLPISVVLEI